jgi:hypothetical protein
MTFRLGKNHPVIDARTMQLSRYLTAALPPLPAAVDYGTKVASWPMYGNDQYGDCTCAAAGHMIQNWTASAGTEVTVPDGSVLALYEHFVGNPPPPDQGCDMLSVLKYWRRTGLDRHKVTAFAGLDLGNDDQARSAIYLLGSVYIGVALPDFAVPPGVDFLSIPWVVPAGGPVGNAAPNPDNGHCIPAVGYDAQGLYVITWGAVKTMSWDFYNAYADEAFGVVSRDFLDRSGANPAGFDLAQLLKDLADISG